MRNRRSAAGAGSRGQRHGPGAIDLALQNPLHYGGLGLRDLRRWLTGLLDDTLSPDAGDAPPVPCPRSLASGSEGTSLTVRFVSDRQIRALNRRYRQIDRATDVLSFQGGEPPRAAPEAASPESLHLGDLVISVPAARRQAAALEHSLSREIRELVLHGFLHLLGYDHEHDGGVMDARELAMRRRWIPEDA